jgi:hypothetical protein
MTSDDHPEPEQRGLSQSDQHSLSQQLQAAWTRVQESADTFQRVTAGLPERIPRPDRRRLQVAWAHAIESAGTIRRGVVDKLQEWLPLRRVTRRRLRLPSRPAVARMPDLTWRDWVLFGLMGATILLALITAAIIVMDMLARGTN